MGKSQECLGNSQESQGAITKTTGIMKVSNKAWDEARKKRKEAWYYANRAYKQWKEATEIHEKTWAIWQEACKVEGNIFKQDKATPEPNNP